MIKYECPYCSMQLKKMEERCPYCGAPGKEFKEIFYSSAQPITPQGNYIQQETPKKDISPQGKSTTAIICLVCGLLSMGLMCTVIGWIFSIAGVAAFIITMKNKEVPRQKKICAIIGFALSLISLGLVAFVMAAHWYYYFW